MQCYAISCNALWSSMNEMVPCWIGCEMIWAMLCNLLWASSLIAPCYSCSIASKDFYIITATIKKIEQFQLITSQEEGWQPFATMETALVITDVLISPVCIMFMITLKHFIFFCQRFKNLSFIKKINLNFSQFFQAICLWILWSYRV